MPRLVVQVSARLVWLGTLLSVSVPAGAQSPSPALSFNRVIRPILADKCFACHGQDAKKREADLRLDTREGATADLGARQAIVPGALEQSEMWRRINSADEYEVMPPPDSHKTLTPEEIALLKQWIEQGAPYQKHWAFEPIERPAIPEVDGATTPIDAFLLERLLPEGLTVEPPADRETLVRRVALALTGLPPTIAEVDEFLADDGSDAYQRMLDRYLASPRYGEEMARHWLDVARYADTHGLHLDNERQMWVYRDWVVKAFNDNLPFDQFTVWQLAGDLLPNPTRDQLIATGFNRCNVTTSEGGAIDAEFAYRYAVERTSTMAQAWLGLTAGCAVCHDHKYDPLTSKEFYSLYAFFNNAADPAMDGNINNTPPFLKVPTPRQDIDTQAASEVERQGREWLDALAKLADYHDPAKGVSASGGKGIVEVLFDDTFPLGCSTRSSSRNAIAWICDPSCGVPSGRRAIVQAHAAECSDTIEYKLRPLLTPQNGQVEVVVRVEPRDIPQSLSLTVQGRKAVTWLRVEGGLAREGSAQPVVVPGTWTKLTIPAADFGLQPGDRVSGIVLEQKGGVVAWDNLRLVGEATAATDPLESLTVWRRTLGTTVPPDLPGPLHPLIQGGPDKELTDDETTQLKSYYLALIARPVCPELAAARQVWDAARTARVIAEESAEGTFIYRESDQARESFVMLRGQYDKPGDKVEPAIPAVLPQIVYAAAPTRLSRLDLANWLVAAENPLTARVTVNRFWQQFMGTGLVKTSYDFGTRGEPPSHPELLDFLASDLRDHGWDVKRLVKTILLSDAFRRDARVSPAAQATDPANRWYARGPRLRLDAEQMRDNALFVSGLINLQMGGRGVRPYQPPNIWEPVGYSDSNTRFYLQDHGPALYRRSLYAFLKRTAPPPFMSNFDGPNREQVCTMRERSNTPLQALQLMNDVQHVEAARALAERVLSEGGGTAADRVTYLFRIVLARRPSEQECGILLSNLEKQQKLYQSHPEEAQHLVCTGESVPRNSVPLEETAAWTMLANLVLNMDETLNRN